ncbi:MAG: DUF4962 domain-containing protein [Rhodopirellula sp.]|nr:DUF4962 domain-containing protein [Rhodopirellula sp.]
MIVRRLFLFCAVSLTASLPEASAGDLDREPSSPAAEVLKIDFEQGADPVRYDGLDFRGATAEIVPVGPDGTGHCLKLVTEKPATACALRITRPVEVVKNLVLSFDYKAEIEEGFEGAYLGMSFFVDGRQWFWTSDDFSSRWRQAQVEIGRLKDDEYVLEPGVVFSQIQLYGRVKDKPELERKTLAKITVWFDNVRISAGPRPSTRTDHSRDSYSDPPTFGWPQPAGERSRRLQYSRSPDFPADATTTVDVDRNFYMPPEPIGAGTWYWRTWTENLLLEGWTPIEQIVVVPDAHRFTTPPLPVAEIAAMARPRLLECAKIGEPPLTDERIKQRIASAEKLFKTGVPEHPGPHVPGDPRWPTWIDWYGKVAGKITGGTGRRLQTIAQYAMLTGDPQVVGWAKELALEACKWDPEGGSAMSRGDIGAHHLLRGLNWCYDACRDRMTDAERDTLQKAIVERAGQFWKRLNPFRHGEANNHAWLQALGVAESGLVLAGEHPEAGDWAEYVRQLYLGRFLCCLGYQGDNNEGIAYWGYGLGFIIDYADLMKGVSGIDFYRHPWLNQTARFPMYSAPPDGWAVSFADTGMPNHGVRGPAQASQVRQLALRTRDPYALWYSGAREAVDGLEPLAPTDLPQSIHYRHIGVGIFNTSLADGAENVAVAMHSGRYQAGHQHPDQNSFVIHAYGEKLAIDGGYYDWYGSPHFKAYSMQTLAHNTLLVDGEGQAACTDGADGRIAAWFDSPGYGYTAGDASDPDIYRGRLKRFDRAILFIKPGFVVVHDAVEAAGPAKLDWLLHAVAPIETDAGKMSFVIPGERAALRGKFLCPPGVHLQVTTGFPVEPVNRYSTDPVPRENYFPEWRLTATGAATTETTEFLAAMQIRRQAGPADPIAEIASSSAENAHAIEIRCNGRRHLVLIRKPGAGGPLRTDGLQCDGQVAAIELDGEGTIRRALALGATRLQHLGQMLWKSDAPADWAMPDSSVGL